MQLSGRCSVNRFTHVALIAIFLPTTLAMLAIGLILKTIGSLAHTAGDALEETSEDLAIWVREIHEQ